MRIYRLDVLGNVITPEGATLAKDSEGGSDNAGRLWAKYRNELSSGEAVTNPYIAPVPTYRELRSDQYKIQLSPEGNFETAVGDVLDAILKSLIDKDDTELLQLAAIIQGIKTDIPEV